jgi:hypothetical protein
MRFRSLIPSNKRKTLLAVLAIQDRKRVKRNLRPEVEGRQRP